MGQLDVDGPGGQRDRGSGAVVVREDVEQSGWLQDGAFLVGYVAGQHTTELNANSGPGLP